MEERSLLAWDAPALELQRKLGEFVQYFQMSLPRNMQGVPTALIDPTVIMSVIATAESTDDVEEETIREATALVDFSEGFPTIEGTPIWERLDGERIEYYRLFKEYREMKEISGSRAIARLADSHDVLGSHLNLLSKVYHWQLRCCAYDKHRQDQIQVLREAQIIELNNKHLSASNTLMDDAMEYFRKHPEQLNPKIAIQMVQTAVNVGRMSLGLSSSKGGGGGSAPTINVQQSTHTEGSAGQVQQVNSVASSKEDVAHLQSILHVLNNSGALTETQTTKEVIDVPDDASECTA